MVRHFVKGGIWKNSEDEILKAAVMKYGKQQWARVASLLNRKSAKQCKARWNEWLDPSIRKVEWSREEDEKLLHLAKLLPAQWKTIGPLVGGRTSVQCQERYEQLLDEAAVGQNEDEKMPSAEEGEGGAGSSMRKLRAGDIDPHPETKPARPDPIDMDDDEIEMLQEARARLANTQGKKAKRKAREKMLNEAKRLADLQKRRELKQAGLLSTSARIRAKRGRREIDYGVEIPFHKPAPAGFHSTAEEDLVADEQRRKRLKQIDFQQINESQYRSRDREEKNAKKREEARLRNLERSNMQYVVAQVSKRNDPISARKRGVLSMPVPSVSDGELEKVAKVAKEHMVESSTIAAMNGIGGNATDALLGDYTDRPLPTPMRTPMTGSGMSSREVVMREASNLRMLERGQTPLLGELNPTLMEGGAGTGVGLKSSVAGVVGSATPMLKGNESNLRSDTANQTPMTTTMGQRDQLGLNRPNSEMRSVIVASDTAGDDVSVSATSFATSIGGQSMSIREMAKAERKALKRARKELEMALANLPAPQFEYELEAPEMVTDDDDQDNKKMDVQKDAADVEAENLAQLEKEAAKLYEKRSSVVKRKDLPRPVGAIIDEMVLDSQLQPANDDDVETLAETLIREEMLAILQHDAFSFPVTYNGIQSEKKKNDKKNKVKAISVMNIPMPPEKPLQMISDESFKCAKEMLDAEVERLIQEKRSMAFDVYRDIESEEEMKALLVQATMKTKMPDEEDISHDDLKVEYGNLIQKIKHLQKQNDKLESKLIIMNGGYMKRCNALYETIQSNYAEIQNSRIEESVYKSLMLLEKRGITTRVEKLEGEIEELESIEANLQKRYGDLLHEKTRHKILIRQKEQSAS